MSKLGAYFLVLFIGSMVLYVIVSRMLGTIDPTISYLLSVIVVHLILIEHPRIIEELGLSKKKESND
ncbi:hypothetical protein [Halalkalibacillus halophilus]|uniref:hypothetical protein n=1 Tax=Halalkalibacillus halophilus TaxID=392827 RepID=UPI000401E2EB|nr:hypothetical protein [Halalkalibacillus halophilus]